MTALASILIMGTLKKSNNVKITNCRIDSMCNNLLFKGFIYRFGKNK